MRRIVDFVKGIFFLINKKTKYFLKIFNFVKNNLFFFLKNLETLKIHRFQKISPNFLKT